LGINRIKIRFKQPFKVKIEFHLPDYCVIDSCTESGLFEIENFHPSHVIARLSAGQVGKTEAIS